jgi:hypothetical protein
VLNWDPALVDAIAERREVVLFDDPGVGGSTGAVPRTFTAMAHDARQSKNDTGLVLAETWQGGPTHGRGDAHRPSARGRGAP